jgi:hypothetical protein
VAAAFTPLLAWQAMKIREVRSNGSNLYEHAALIQQVPSL